MMKNLSKLKFLTIIISLFAFSGCTNLIEDLKDKSILVNSIVITSEDTMEVGESKTLSVTFYPENTTDKTVNWSSSNEAVAVINDGVITAISVGTSKITAKSGTAEANYIIKVVDKIIPVTSVILDSSASIMLGQTKQLTATLLPENATNKTVTWTSSDVNVATVENGLITAVGIGNTVIKASAGGKEAICLVTVVSDVIPVASISMDSSASIVKGTTKQLTATVLPENATNKTITWTSSDTNVVTVENGLVTAVSVGSANITATADGKSTVCLVTVVTDVIPVASITMDSTASIVKGATKQLNATVLPENATNKTVTWTSSDTSIVTVENGVVTAVSVGSANITATADGVSKVCLVTVVTDVIPVASITMDSTASIVKGTTKQLTATVLPENATNKTVTWTSLDTSVVTVENGVVTAVSVGSANITATAGGVSKVCLVTVVTDVIPVASITMDSSVSIVKGTTKQLTAIVLPENATNKTVTWTSSDTSVATVENGLVTAVSVGSANITATAGGVSTVCLVTVVTDIIPVTSITMDSSASIVKGTTKQLTAIVLPENATNKTVTWTSSDTSVATVENGLVTAVSVGSANITATADGKSTVCLVTVVTDVIPVASINLEPNISINKNEEKQLIATVLPVDATDKTIIWTSSDPEIVSITETGKIKGLKTGNVVISASAGEKITFCSVIVHDTLETTNITVTFGEDTDLSCTVTDSEIIISEDYENFKWYLNGKLKSGITSYKAALQELGCVEKMINQITVIAQKSGRLYSATISVKYNMAQ